MILYTPPKFMGTPGYHSSVNLGGAINTT